MKTKTNLLAAVCLAFCCLTANARQVNCGSHSHSKDENTCHLSSAVEQERVRLRDSILTNISGARIAEKTLLISRLEAKNDGKTDCRAAFAKTIRKASAMKGAKIVVPAGTYYIKGPIVLASHDVAIIGEGTIDGNAMTTFAQWRPKQKLDKDLSRKMNHEEVALKERQFGKGHWLRPQLLQLYNCQGVTIEGVKITNSPFWCVHLLKSENIICRNLRYDAKLVNNDGIDPECSRNVLIEGVEFNNGDDNVAIKSGRDNDGWNAKMPSENIIIRNCHFKGLHAVVIGSEMSAGVRNVIVEDCDYAGYCKRGIFIKTNPDRGGFVENVYVKNCSFDEVEDLFYVTSRYAGEGQDNHYFSTIRNIFIDGLKCNNVKQAALVFQGTQAKPVFNVMFNNVDVAKAKIGLSFENALDVTIGSNHIGGKVGTPTTVTPHDNLFGKEK